MDFWGEVDSKAWGGLAWTSRQKLSGSRKTFPRAAGLYRVRAQSAHGLVYVGQTGRNLRERVGALALGVYRDTCDPPWNDRHTAAPILWAFRHEDAMDFEVSVAPLSADRSERQCVEDFLLYGHRVKFGRSTLANLGRMHPRWTRPTNRAKGQAAERRPAEYRYPSLPVAVGDPDPSSQKWLDLDWSPFRGWAAAAAGDGPGVYRVQRNGEPVYFGESGRLADRLQSHAQSPRFEGCEVSFLRMPGAMRHHLLEREVDLIGAFYAVRRRPPLHQYQPASS